MSYPPPHPPDSHPLASLSAAAAAQHSRSFPSPSASTSSPATFGSSMPRPGSHKGTQGHGYPQQHQPQHVGSAVGGGGGGHHSLTHSPESTTSPAEHHPHHFATPGNVSTKRRRVDAAGAGGGDSPGASADGKKKSKTVSCTECKVRRHLSGSHLLRERLTMVLALQRRKIKVRRSG